MHRQQRSPLTNPHGRAISGSAGPTSSQKSERMRTVSASESPGDQRQIVPPARPVSGWPSSPLSINQPMSRFSNPGLIDLPLPISDFAIKRIHVAHHFQVDNFENVIQRCSESWSKLPEGQREFYQFGAAVETFVDFDVQLKAQRDGAPIFYVGERYATSAAPELAGFTWHISVFPTSPLAKAVASRGYDPFGINDYSDHLAVYLHLRSSSVGKEMQCDVQHDCQLKVTFSLLDHNGGRCFTQSSDIFPNNIEKRRLGFDKFIKLEELTRSGSPYLQNGTLNLLVEVEILYRPSEISVTVSDPPRSFTTELLDKLRGAERCYDVVISGSEGNFKCLRTFLADRCGVFGEYFRSEQFLLLAAGAVPVPIIRVPGLDGYLLTDLIRFAYTGEITPNPEVAAKLLRISKQYETEELKGLCETILIFALNSNNCNKYLQLSQECSADQLEMAAALFIRCLRDGSVNMSPELFPDREAVVRYMASTDRPFN